MKIIMPKVVKTTYFEQIRGDGEVFYTVVIKLKKPLFSLFGRVFWYSENYTICVERRKGFIVRWYLSTNFGDRIRGFEFRSLEVAKEHARACIDYYMEKQLQNHITEFRKVFEDEKGN